MVDIIADDWIKYNTSKIVIDIEEEINNILIKDDQGYLNDNDDKKNNYHNDLDRDLEEEEEEDFKLNYGSELSEDMYIYSSDDE